MRCVVRGIPLRPWLGPGDWSVAHNRSERAESIQPLALFPSTFPLTILAVLACFCVQDSALPTTPTCCRTSSPASTPPTSAWCPSPSIRWPDGRSSKQTESPRSDCFKRSLINTTSNSSNSFFSPAAHHTLLFSCFPFRKPVMVSVASSPLASFARARLPFVLR